MKLSLFFRNRGGQSLLVLVILIGAIIVMAGTVFIIVSLSLSSSAYAYRGAQMAESVALAGIEDVQLQLARNNTFSSVGYTVPVSSWSATVSVSQNAPSAGYVTATSLTTIFGSTRKLTALFGESSTTGQMNLISLRETQ